MFPTIQLPHNLITSGTKWLRLSVGVASWYLHLLISPWSRPDNILISPWSRPGSNNVTIEADYKTFAPLLAAPYLCRRIRAMMRSGSLEITFTSVFRRKNIKHRYILYQAAIDHQHWNRTEY